MKRFDDLDIEQRLSVKRYIKEAFVDYDKYIKHICFTYGESFVKYVDDVVNDLKETLQIHEDDFYTLVMFEVKKYYSGFILRPHRRSLTEEVKEEIKLSLKGKVYENSSEFLEDHPFENITKIDDDIVFYSHDICNKSYRCAHFEKKMIQPHYDDFYLMFKGNSTVKETEINGGYL